MDLEDSMTANETAEEFVFADRISLNKVSFSYPDGREALHDVSFEIKKGEKIALVGENGAGKTTIVKLLSRMYDPTSGQILVDDVSLKDLNVFSWRKSITAVFQDFGKYFLTIRENIILGDLNRSLDDANIDKAIADSGSDFVYGLSDGLATKLGKRFGGSELSGGQWQRLAIARALIAKNSEILILDEPSASLDPRAEVELYEKLAVLAEGKTVIFVTHRLASIKMADKIIVLKDGRVIEQGSHDELMRKNGEYAELYRLQAEKFKDSV